MDSVFAIDDLTVSPHPSTTKVRWLVLIDAEQGPALSLGGGGGATCGGFVCFIAVSHPRVTCARWTAI